MVAAPVSLRSMSGSCSARSTPTTRKSSSRLIDGGISSAPLPPAASSSSESPVCAGCLSPGPSSVNDSFT